MSTQSLRQVARRDARTVASKRRSELLDRSKRLEDLAVEVMTAVREREIWVAKAERMAGDALREMTAVEGLSLREAVEWCGHSVDLREATRLRKVGTMPDRAEGGGRPATRGDADSPNS